MTKEFAGATYNTELRYTAAEGFQFSAADRTQFLLALGKKQTTFNSGGVNFTYVQEDPNTYRIFRLNPIAEGLAGSIRSTTGTPLSQSVLDGYAKAVEDKVDEFTADGVLYQIVKSGKVTQITQEMEVALGTLNVFDAYNQADQAFVNS